MKRRKGAGRRTRKSSRKLRSRREILRVLAEGQKRLGALPGVEQIALGKKRVGLTPKRSRALVVGVAQKLPLPEVPENERIPKSMLGVATDVVPVRRITKLDCPIDAMLGELPLPNRPGGWIGPPGTSNWGSVCLFLKDQRGRVYALTARHVAGRSDEVVIDRPLAIPTQAGCPPGETLVGHVVRTTTVDPDYYDTVLVEIEDAHIGHLKNTPYGCSTRVRGIASALPRHNTRAVFHGARLAHGGPRPATVMSSYVVQVSQETGAIPDGRTWIEFNATLSKGDSGGLFTTADGSKAIALLQLGRTVDDSTTSANPVYAVPIASILQDLAQDAAPGSSLPGYERLSLTLL